MTDWTEQLYGLLPTVYQNRDVGQGQPLRQLLSIVGEQVQLIEQDIEGLYDNWFIETCDSWLVPYLGDLVGHASVQGAALPSSAALARNPFISHLLYPRREIATLVERRRRKGTLPVLEDVANDVTRWRARAVEFSRLTTFFQHTRHPQARLGRSACVRDSAAMIRLNTPFDRTAHTVDVRPISSCAPKGWYHPRKVGLFVWRRNIYSATQVTPCEICTSCEKHTHAYTFDRLGLRQPIFINPRAEAEELSIASEQNLPLPLYRHLLARKPSRTASCDYYGYDDNEPRSVAIELKWNESDRWSLVPARHVHVRDLTDESHWHGIASHLPNNHCALDPECGVFLFKSSKRPCAVRVTYHYASSQDLGGGEYHRPVSNVSNQHTVRVRPPEGCRNKPSNLFQSVCCAFQQTDEGPCGEKLVNPLQGCHDESKSDEQRGHTTWKVVSDLCVEILGSDTYQLPANESLEIAPGVVFEIRAASGSWPLIHVCSTNCAPCGNPWQVSLGRESTFVLDGLQICGATMQLEDLSDDEYPPQVQQCDPCTQIEAAVTTNKHFESLRLRRAVIRHTTFVPGGRAAAFTCTCQPNHASVVARLTDGQMTISRSILGTLYIDHSRCHHRDDKAAHGCTCPQDPLSLRIYDSIIDAAHGRMAVAAECCWPAHADLQIERTTVLGDVCVQQIAHAEDSVFCGIVHVQRRGTGYMRFCYVPTDWQSLESQNGKRYCDLMEQMRRDWMKWLDAKSPGVWEFFEKNCCSVFRTPVRFKCPDGYAAGVQQVPQTNCICDESTPAAAVPAFPSEVPTFASTQYGNPGYCELALDCPPSILRGAEDESEMGVFHDLYNPQRSAALAARLTEYIPAEMESAVIYADDLYSAHLARRRHHSTCSC